MIYKTTIRDFVDSEFCKKETFRISAARIRDGQKYKEAYEKFSKDCGIDIRIVYKGRQDLRNYANSLIPDLRDRCISGENIELRFEDFRVFFAYMPEFAEHSNPKAHLKDIIVYIDCNVVMLPRKTEIKTFFGEILVHDIIFGQIYILPSLNYPSDRLDLLRMVRWLRLKQYLVLRYNTRGEGKKVRFRPQFATFCNDTWWKYALIRTRADDIEPEYISLLDVPSIENIYGVEAIIDFRNNSIQSNLESFYEKAKLLPAKPITQGLINEFIEKDNNRYKIYR